MIFIIDQWNHGYKKWYNDIDVYSIQNEENSVVSERCIRTFNKKVYKHMTSVSKNVYIDKLDDIANKYNNTYYRTIKMKSIDVKLSAYIDFIFKNNERYPIFSISNIVRISKYKNVFAKGYTPNWSEEDFAIKKVKNIVWWFKVIDDIND